MHALYLFIVCFIQTQRAFDLHNQKLTRASEIENPKSTSLPVHFLMTDDVDDSFSRGLLEFVVCRIL